MKGAYKMIIVTKLKGKPYKTDEPCKALEVYKNCKHSTSIISDGAVIRSKLQTGETGNRIHNNYMERC
jgi:hypothetical protein